MNKHNSMKNQFQNVNPKHESSEGLTTAEELALVSAIGLGTGRGFTEEEAKKVWNWAHEIRFNQALLELALAGSIGISFKGGELQFSLVNEPPSGSKKEVQGRTRSS